MKIRTKIILFVLLPLLLIYLGISIVNGLENYRVMKKLAEENFLAQTENIAARISRDNERGVSVAKSTATASQILFSKRAESTALIKEIMQAYPDFVGGSIGYQVNADYNDFRSERGMRNLRDGKDVGFDDAVDSYGFKINLTSVSYDEWLAKSEGGRFAAYWSRAKGDLTLEPLVDMDSSMYSAGLKKKLDSGDSERFIVTEPYVYNNKSLMVEYAAPIFYENRFVGQVAFDKDLSDISNTVSSLKYTVSADVFLLSSQARIIACTKNQNLRTVSVTDLFTDENGSFVMTFLRDENGRLMRDASSVAAADISKWGTTYRDILSSSFETAKGAGLLSGVERKTTYFEDPKTKVSYCVSQAVVRPGNWVVVQMMPESEVLAPVYEAVKNRILGASFFLFITFLSLFLIRAFMKRIVSATLAAEQIASGNLDIEIPSPESSKDETGKLLLSVSEMIRKLREMFRQVDESCSAVENSAFGVDRTGQNAENSLREFGSAADAVSASARRMSERSSDLNSKSESVFASASDAAQIVESGKTNLSEMTEVVSELSRNTASVSRRFAIISERAGNITRVVTTISKVADETNLLSLNASIEAEKAGTYGVGFAVVAREIGRLAEQTAVATSDIDAVVKDLKTAVESGADEMKKFSESVASGAEEMSRTASAVESVISKMEAIAPQIEALSSGISGQRESAVELASKASAFESALSQVDLLATQSSEMRKRLRASIEKMRSQISSFKLGGD